MHLQLPCFLVITSMLLPFLIPYHTAVSAVYFICEYLLTVITFFKTMYVPYIPITVIVAAFVTCGAPGTNSIQVNFPASESSSPLMWSVHSPRWETFTLYLPLYDWNILPRLYNDTVSPFWLSLVHCISSQDLWWNRHFSWTFEPTGAPTFLGPSIILAATVTTKHNLLFISNQLWCGPATNGLGTSSAMSVIWTWSN